MKDPWDELDELDELELPEQDSANADVEYRATCVEFPALDGAAPAPSLPGEVPVMMCSLPSGKHPKYPGLELRRVAILWRRTVG